MKKFSFIIIILSIFIFPSLIQAAGTFPIGVKCNTDGDCQSGKCQDSNLDQDNDNFCTCQNENDCKITYGKAPTETWVCKDGIDMTKKLNYCQNGAEPPMYPLTSAEIIDAADGKDTPAMVTLTKPNIVVDIPGMEPFTDITVNPGESAAVPYLAQYIISIYRYGIIFGSIIAVVMLMIGGILFLTSGGIPANASKGKELIFGSIIGIVLLICSNLILKIINPNLTKLDPITLESIKEAYVSPYELVDYADTEPTTTSTEPTTGATPAPGKPGQAPGALTKSKDELFNICNLPEADWPKTVPGMSSPDTTFAGFSSAGIKTSNKGILHDNSLKLGLTKMGEMAQSYTGGPYEILIVSGYRPLANQLKIACAHKNETPIFTKIGGDYAWPGGSLHGIGKAIDVILYKDGKALTTAMDNTAQHSPKYNEANRILAEIAYSSGWKRYTKEIWHFEYQSGITTCRTNTCIKSSFDCNCR